MVGNTTHVMQVVGWLPIHVIESLPLPYWLGTWEGARLQVLSAAFVIGSYYLAEYTQKRATHAQRLSALAEVRYR